MIKIVLQQIDKFVYIILICLGGTVPSKTKLKTTRLTLDLVKSDVDRAKELKQIYQVPSQADAVRVAIRHDHCLAVLVSNGGTILHRKADGTIETIAFNEWLPYMATGK